MPVERKLRSNVDSKVDKSLFNFDNCNKLLFQNIKIKVSADLCLDDFYCSNTLDLPQYIEKQTNLVEKQHDLPRKSKNKADPLSDEAFYIYHKRMQKEEKRMSNLDKEKIVVEVDKLNYQAALLNQHDWMKHLPTITHIKHSKDTEEQETKKRLTMKEIKMMISKYNNWKRREEQLSQSIKAFNNNRDDDPTDSEDDTMSVQEINKRRFKRRCAKYGPIVKLKLGNDLILVIDPILPPKIITTNKPSQLTNKETVIKKNGHKIQTEIFREKVKVIEKKQKNTIELDNIDVVIEDGLIYNHTCLTCNENNDVAFGQKIPTLKEKQFHFPSAWKTKYTRDNVD